MDALYVKTDEGLVKLNLGTSGSSGGGTSVAVVRECLTTPSAIASGTEYKVPKHTVGSTELVVAFNGVVCKPGEDEQYFDVSTTTIRFNFNIPAGSEIDVISFRGAESVLS